MLFSHRTYKRSPFLTTPTKNPKCTIRQFYSFGNQIDSHNFYRENKLLGRRPQVERWAVGVLDMSTKE